MKLKPLLEVSCVSVVETLNQGFYLSPTALIVSSFTELMFNGSPELVDMRGFPS